MRGQGLGPRITVLTVSLVLLTGRAGRGQPTGSIAGRVSDGTGATLTGVTVEVTSTSLQRRRFATTGPDGAYRFTAVLPGTYSLQASLPGFRAVEKSAAVTLDATTRVDLVLVLSTLEHVVVSDEAPPIDRNSTTAGTSYSYGVIDHLPVARNYADIVRANPGVDTDHGETQGRALALTVYGATSAENQWNIDGVNTTSVFKGTQGSVIPSEFIEVVEVKTGGYQAEYGRALGGIISAVTRSGGNAFHGDSFAYYDSVNTAAHKQSQPGDSVVATMQVVDGQRLDYGIDLGGFLLKDRLWFFGAYDRASVQAHVSQVQSFGNVTKDDRFPFEGTDTFYSGKLTWNAGPSTSIVGTAFADPTNNSGAAGADPQQGLGAADVSLIVSPDPSTWYSKRYQGGVNYGLRFSQLLGSHAIVTLQGSSHSERNSLTPPDGIRTEDDTCSGGTLDHPCAFPEFPSWIRGGYGQVFGFSDHNESTRRQYGGNLSLYSGNHTIKAGGDYMDGRTDALFFFTGGQSVYIGNEYGQRYYLHDYYAVSRDDPTPVSQVHLGAQVLDYGAFVQDTWSLAQGLTVNVGLRWDGERTRNYAGETVLRFGDGWQPRVGVAWDPWRDGATKIYAFAGRFSYGLPTTAAAWVFGNFTEVYSYNTDPVSLAQDPSIANHSQYHVENGGGPYGDAVDSPLKAPYQDELTAGVERLIQPAVTVGLKATYRRLGRALERRCDFYQSCALINPGSDGRFARGDAPTCSGTWEDPDYQCPSGAGPATPAARRVYRGLELFARGSVGTRLWLQGSFVYSSLRGNYDGGVREAGYDQTVPGITGAFGWPADWHNGYGILALDRPYRLRLDGFYVTPWRLSIGLQTFVESGTPFNRMGYFNACSCVFLVPRGTAGRLPTLWEANLTLSYPIAIGPVTVTPEAYLFNLFNQQIVVSRDETWGYGPPDGYPANIYDPDQKQYNPYYGSATARQEPLRFRAAVKVSF